MTGRVRIDTHLVIKDYPDPAACQAALANYRILASLNSSTLIPNLLAADDTRLTFARLPGRAAEPADLPQVAEALGRLDRAAQRAMPQAVDQNRALIFGGTTIPGFANRRHQRLLDLLTVPDTGCLLAARDVDRLFAEASRRPAALYKDANPRNFLIHPPAPVAIIDFDDLTLAPFGYELAKLVVTLAMTHGPLPATLIETALRAYNRAAAGPDGAAAACPPRRLRMFCELHHLLTADYLGRNGYRHPWPQVRSWTDLEGHR